MTPFDAGRNRRSLVAPGYGSRGKRDPAKRADGALPGVPARLYVERREPSGCESGTVVDEGERDGVGRLVIITGLPGSGKTTLATELASVMPAVRMCPDDWMMSSGIDLWDSGARGRIEQFQLTLSLELLSEGHHVVIEWGVWTRRERDELRDAARSVGAQVELRYVTAGTDELWRRIVERDLEGRWGSRSIRRDELDAWTEVYQVPDAEEMSTYDRPHSG